MLSNTRVLLALLPAAAALSIADPKDASAEVAKRCMSGDFSGATALLESRGKPIGWQHGKYMLMTCFTDETGKCLLTSSQCAWMQQCLEEEGPCQRPSISMLLELPGGELAMKELNKSAVTVNGQTRYKMSKILEVTKAMAAILPKEQKSASFMQQSQQAQLAINRRRKADTEALKAEADEISTTTFTPVDEKLKEMLKTTLTEQKHAMAEVKYDKLSTERKKINEYGQMTLPIFYLGTCGMVDDGVMVDAKGEPLYAKFNPGPADTTPTEYVDVIHKWTPRFKELYAKDGEFLC